MPSLNTDTDTYLNKLRAAQDARMEHASVLAGAAARREQAQADLAAAEADYAREHRAAINAGWTERELRDAGLTAPAAIRAATPRRSSRARAATGETTARPSEPATPDHSPEAITS